MDIERQNFLSEFKAEKQNTQVEATKPKAATTENIDAAFWEATNKFDKTLKKLKD